MTEQKQIEEMAVIGCVRNPQAHTAEECEKCDFKEGQCNEYRHAKALYDTGYRKASDEALKLLLEAPYDELRKFCIKYYNEAKDLRQEVVELKVDNEHLTNKLRYVLLSIDTAKEMNAMCNIDEHRKQAIKEFAEKLKKRTILYSGINVKYEAITADIIDELLKEYEI